MCVRVFMCVNVLLNAADDLTNRSRTEKEDRQKRGRKRRRKDRVCYTESSFVIPSRRRDVHLPLSS